MNLEPPSRPLNDIRQNIFDIIGWDSSATPYILELEVAIHNEAYEDGWDEGRSDMLYEHFGGTLPG